MGLTLSAPKLQEGKAAAGAQGSVSDQQAQRAAVAAAPAAPAAFSGRAKGRKAGAACHDRWPLPQHSATSARAGPAAAAMQHGRLSLPHAPRAVFKTHPNESPSSLMLEQKGVGRCCSIW